MENNRGGLGRNSGEKMTTDPTSIQDIVKFTVLAALFAMFGDAIIAHAMLWGNDPYWTYWITDGFLMCTVFGVGTALFGVGKGRGAILTAVHILLLTTYYWTLSPIGLPSHGEWLDLERTWITGLPVHFGIYYLGYLTALWLWYGRLNRMSPAVEQGPIKRSAISVLVAAAAIVVVLGVIQTLVQGEFPGVTWFIVRLAISFPFILGWKALAGRTHSFYLAGGLCLALLLGAYSHYLAPIGLPNPSLRLIAENPPSVNVHWLSYRDEFLILLPVTILVTVGAFLLLRWTSVRHESTQDKSGVSWKVLIPLLILLITGILVFDHVGSDARQTHIVAGESAQIEQGEYLSGNMVSGNATFEMKVENRNNHRTPLPPHDKVDIRAVITDVGGRTFEVVSTQPMVADPLGRFTTWSGVGYDVWHHGRSGIGTSKIPATHSDVAVYAVGDILTNGQLLVSGVPIHVMTTTDEAKRLELQVGSGETPITWIPDKHFRIVWNDFSSDYSREADFGQYAWGGVWLLTLLVLVFVRVKQSETLLADKSAL